MKQLHKITMKARAKVLLGFLTLATLNLASGCVAAPKQIPEIATIDDLKIEQVLGNQFPSGFYYYDAKINGQTPLEQITADLNKMADMGFNYVHANVAIYEGKVDYPQIDHLLDICAKRGMMVRLQCTGAAYLSNALAGRHTTEWKKGWNIQRVVNAIVPFIEKYKTNPYIISFEVQEEPDLEVLPLLHQYYAAIIERVPDVNLSLLYNNLSIAIEDKSNHYPRAILHDNYPFKRTTVNGVYNLRTPDFALKFYASQMDAFQQLANAKNQSFEAVFSGFAEEAELTSPSGRDLLMAKSNNHGFSLGTEGQVLRWNRYRPPINHTSAMCWIALSKGASAILNYAWQRTSVSEKRKTRTALILGWDNKGSHVLDEFATFAQKVRPFGKLMRSASRDVTSFTMPSGSGDIVPIASHDNPVMQTPDQGVIWGSFTVPNYQGRLVIVVNTKIGAWNSGESPLYLKDEDDFLINNVGEVIGYTPVSGSRDVIAKVLLPDHEASDLMTGQKIAMAENGDLRLNIAPGEGKIFFLSPHGSNEAQRLNKEYGLR